MTDTLRPLTNPELALLSTSDLTITGHTTDTAVILTARFPGPDGQVVAKGRTKSRGYRFLVVRYLRPVHYSNTPADTEVKASLTVCKRTGNRSVAEREARNNDGAVLLAVQRDGTYVVVPRASYF